jgi:hypothetical protein
MVMRYGWTFLPFYSLNSLGSACVTSSRRFVPSRVGYRPWYLTGAGKYGGIYPLLWWYHVPTTIHPMTLHEKNQPAQINKEM